MPESPRKSGTLGSPFTTLLSMKKTCAPGVPKFGSSGPAAARWAFVMSTSACSAPKEPAPPIPWPQPVTCSSPVIVPSAKRSNSTQPQKPPSSGLPVSGFWQNDDVGLLQLPETPICHVSWLAPPPQAHADEANPAATAAAPASAA